jgi:threonine/homoserine/homoserine lactone efflux protein
MTLRPVTDSLFIYFWFSILTAIISNNNPQTALNQILFGLVQLIYIFSGMVEAGAEGKKLNQILGVVSLFTTIFYISYSFYSRFLP